MRSRRPMFPEVAQYTAGFLLSSKPRSHLYEPLDSSSYLAPVLECCHIPHQPAGGYWASAQRYQPAGGYWASPQRYQPAGGYWASPQRYQPAGSSWRTLRHQLVVFPGNTGFSDVPSSHPAGFCRLHHTLVWKYRWQKLREQIGRLRH